MPNRSGERSVLGIDAAWTGTGSSGVALIIEEGDRWRLIALEDSYHRFHALASGRERVAGKLGSIPNAEELLESAHTLSGGPVDLVAVDMPLALTPIIGRRSSDDAISRTYGGARWASTHSPSGDRPGIISDQLRHQFRVAGYPLLTSEIALPGLIEVYPHPAIMELCGEFQRLPYKFGNRRKFWPLASGADRRANILIQWQIIIAKLAEHIDNLQALELPALTANPYEWKAFEDCLDAVVCAWVGVEAMLRRAVPYGDTNSAIWNPIER
jgi:predicted RNase H-like nuclease